MIETASNGKLRININNICKMILLLYICTLYAFYEVRLFLEAVYIGIFFLYFITRRKKLTIYALWNLLFVGICILSNLWTIASVDSFNGTRSTIEIAIIGNLIIAFIDRKEKIFYLINCFVIAGVVLVFRLLIMVPISEWANYRIGNTIYNSNTIGLYLAISAICALQMAKINKKLIYYILICIFFIVVALTGSRKAFFLLVLGMFFLYLFNTEKKSKMVFAVPTAIFLVVIGYQVIMNVPQFYAILGWRIKDLINLITGEGSVDASARMRMTLIQTGMQLFHAKPYLGYGIASYTQVSGMDVYSHNNYVELLVGVGLIGTGIYYSIYLYSISCLLKLRKKHLGNVFLVIMILLVVMDYGLVSYSGEVYQIIIASSIAAIKLIKDNNGNIHKV